MKKTTKRDNQGRFAKNYSEFSFVNLATYTSPEIIEVKNRDWVQYGADNNYFQFLIDRYNGSPTNNACINGISQAIYGKGLNATDSSSKPSEYAQMITLLKPDMVQKVSYDLKLMGQAAIQVVYSKDRTKIAMCEHFPIETLRAEKADENGDITGYYYWNDWTTIKPSDKPLRIPAYGTSKENIEIYYIKPYKAGFYYYSPVDYQGGLQYSELEEEISNYHLNNILNGLAPSMLINFNNGTPNQEQRELIEQRIAQKFSGSSNAGKFILAFNDNKESQAEITPVQLSDAHQQYQFLSTESQSKILVSHRVVSPMLLGIKDSTGLGNNADEIKTASLLMDNTVIRPFQELLINCFDKLLAYNDIALNLYFITLQPLEFTEVDRDIQDDEDIEEETGVEMEKLCDVSLSKDNDDEVATELISLGEDIDLETWEVIDEIDVDYDNEDKYDAIVDVLNSENEKKATTLSKIINLVSTGRAYPNARSSQDEKIKENFFKVRYYYFPKNNAGGKTNSPRAFCKAMVSANKLYRKEDIIRMTDRPVNAGWGPKGDSETYSIWKYKGGGNCHHSWRRLTFKSKDANINVKTSKDIIGTRAAEIDGYKVRNDFEVSIQPRSMDYRGFMPDNPWYKKDGSLINPKKKK
tara:strand:- start:886 stop:2799 length:1914 start_codon:yes stop_codon:yes gene_type:complete